ncbi:MAG TPA: head GIN domain-containing protein [Bacteroidia bacterium]|nr:head GIN domain-containing protein [Bacteroidia bacterium]
MLRCISISTLLFSYLILFTSCKKQNDCDCIKSRGSAVTETRVITTPFKTLQTFDKIEVYYIQDTTITTPTVRVETGKNLMSNISTEVSDGTLQIKNLNKCNFVRSNNDVTVYVTAPHVYYFVQDGVGNIYSSNTITQDSVSYNVNNSGDIHLNLNVNRVYGRLYGVGDVYLNGIGSYHLVNAKGECFINAQNLQTFYSYVVYGSTGEARINVSNQLDAEMDYTGNLYYSGSATYINRVGNGSGQVIKN